jgi:hypothetical protein
MDKSPHNAPVSLEALLKLKKCEQPDEQFWDSFEQSFHRRRLNSLVERDEHSWRLWNPLVKLMTVAVPALGLLALGLLGSRSHEAASPVLAEVSQEDILAHSVPSQQVRPNSGEEALSVFSPSSSHLASQFVLDALEERSATTRAFRKVLYTPALQASSPTGASYVRDTLSTRAYRVTTADVKLGRNF